LVFVFFKPGQPCVDLQIGDAGMQLFRWLDSGFPESQLRIAYRNLLVLELLFPFFCRRYPIVHYTRLEEGFAALYVFEDFSRRDPKSNQGM
jgi:hypothetical protein